MNDMLVCCSGLTKSYGAKPALDHVDLQLAPGKIIGLLGPNGSGKTTLIKILTGLLRQTEGSVAIDGKPIGPETKALVSYLPDRMYYAGWMKTKDMVNFFADFYPDFRRERAEAMCRALGIGLDMRVKTMSKGTKEKLQLLLVMSRAARGRRSGRARLHPADDPDELFAREHRPDLDAPDRGHRAGA